MIIFETLISYTLVSKLQAQVSTSSWMPRQRDSVAKGFGRYPDTIGISVHNGVSASWLVEGRGQLSLF